jgi:hypothetical protein
MQRAPEGSERYAIALRCRAGVTIANAATLT